MKVEGVLAFLAPILVFGTCILCLMGYSDIIYNYVGVLYVWAVIGGVILLFYEVYDTFFKGDVETGTVMFSALIIMLGVCIFLLMNYSDIIYYYFGELFIWSVGGGAILIYLVTCYQFFGKYTLTKR